LYVKHKHTELIVSLHVNENVCSASVLPEAQDNNQQTSNS